MCTNLCAKSMIDSTDFTLSIFTLMIDAYLRSLRNSLFAKKLTDLLFLEFDIGKQFLHHILLDFPQTLDTYVYSTIMQFICNSKDVVFKYVFIFSMFSH